MHRLVVVALAALVAGVVLERSAAAADVRCPVTAPNHRDIGWVIPGSRYHGNGKLSTVLYYPVLRATARNLRPDGWIEEKFPWWRAVRGRLTISGRRLDRAAPPLRALIPEGYGDTGFQATAIAFPTPGCWRVTGRAGRASLTFVVLVRKAA